MRNRHILNIARAVQYRETDKLIDLCEKSDKSDLVAALGLLSKDPDQRLKFLHETIEQEEREYGQQVEKAG